MKNASETTSAVLLSVIVLSVAAAGVGATQADVSVSDRPEKEFVGSLQTEARQIGNLLYVKYVYTSDELRHHHNVDHIYREEIRPIPEGASEEDIRNFTSGRPQVAEDRRFNLIHEDESHRLRAFQDANSGGMPTNTYQQWKVVGVDTGAFVLNTLFYDPQALLAGHTENWASKKESNAYLAYDPINLIWTDTSDDDGDLITKVTERIEGRGWDGFCIYSTDLWLNVDGEWMRQTEHFIDSIFGPTCDQYHVRAWAVSDDRVLGSGHEEYLGYKAPWERLDIQHVSATGPNYTEYDAGTYGGFYHLLKGFESAEEEAAEEFSGSCWTTSEDFHWLNNEYTRKTFKNDILEGTAYNDGYATVMNCS